MKKLDYKKPTMKVYPLVLNEPILAGSDPNGSAGGELDGNNNEGDGSGA